MQKLGTLLFIFLVLLACGTKQSKKKNESKTSLTKEKTSIIFTEKMHNFGKLTAGEIVIFSFEFTNTGKTAYEIKGIESDCGCLHTRFSATPVMPGKKGKIEVELNTSGLVGREFKTIEIHGNSKELKHLAIFAEVKNELLDIKL